MREIFLGFKIIINLERNQTKEKLNINLINLLCLGSFYHKKEVLKILLKI